jgi:hypothetical protein
MVESVRRERSRSFWDCASFSAGRPGVAKRVYNAIVSIEVVR